ncbi:hypothetical protein ACWDNT_32005 [Streptomyces sp. NPDC000963]|uniref:hypothetical protein n=1 Tax=unclassified Streptomyces TaxID=2593676 RepID=UPI00139295DA|nr:hypothetical protein [Streptomyces sp. SID2131]
MTKTNRNDRRESRSAAEYALYTGQFAEALRTSIARSGFSLQRLSAKLLERGIKVSPAALSYWQSGSNRPERDQSLRAVGHLEEILGLPHRTLLTLLGPPRPRGRWSAALSGPADRHHLWSEPAALDDALRLLGEETARALTDVSHLSVHVRSVLGPDHRCTGSRFRRVLRAERDHVDRVLLVVHTSGADLLVEGLDGCRAGRIRTPATAEYTVVELILDRVLARGETAAVDYTLRYPDGGPWSHTRHVLYRPADVLVLETDFHRDGLPSRCTAFYSPRRTTPERRLATLFLGTTHRAHFTVAGAGAGMYGMRWE